MSIAVDPHPGQALEASTPVAPIGGTDPLVETEKTLEALLNDLSSRSSTKVWSDQARLVAAEWAGRVDLDKLSQRPKYHFISSVMLNGQKTQPFKSRGFELGQLWGDVAQPAGVGDLNRVVDASMDRPVGDTLVELDKLNGRIRTYLEHLQPGPPPVPPAGPPRGDGTDRQARDSGRRGSGTGTQLHIEGS